MKFLVFHGSGPSLALTVGRKKIRIFSKTRRDIRDFWCLAGVNDTGETYYSGVVDTGKNHYTGINDTATLYTL